MSLVGNFMLSRTENIYFCFVEARKFKN
jgi:hypothetical protein